MNKHDVERIFDQCAYVRWGESDQELQFAYYIQDELKKFGLSSYLHEFDVAASTIKHASLTVTQPYTQDIACKGYFNSGNIDICAPLYYLRYNDMSGSVTLLEVAQRFANATNLHYSLRLFGVVVKNAVYWGLKHMLMIIRKH